MIEFIIFVLQGIILLVIGLIISDIISFIYKVYKYYENISPGDIYMYYELPNKKIATVIIEKNKGLILFQHIYPDGSKGALYSSFIPLFYLSSRPEIISKDY